MKTISRHRLPEPYRSLLCGLWLTPTALLLLTAIHINGLSLGLLHPFTLLAVGLMTLPAWYVWNEGVDVTEKSLRIRINGWRVCRYDQLDTWYLDERDLSDRVLTVWDASHRRVIHTHAAHLSDLPMLLRALKSRVRWRGWPG